MVTTDTVGETAAIQQVIGSSYRSPPTQQYGDLFLDRLKQVRDRLQGRLDGLPDDRNLEKIVAKVSGQTLKTLVDSGPWDTSTMGGEEADIDLLWQGASKPASASPPAQTVTREISPSVTETAELAATSIWSRLVNLTIYLALAAAVLFVLAKGPTRAFSEAPAWGQSWSPK